MKRNDQSLQEIWNYVKRPNLCLIGVPECDRKSESKLGYDPGKLTQASKAGQYSSSKNTENTTKTFLKKRKPKTQNRQIHQVEMKEKMLRAAREKRRVTHKQKPIRLTADHLEKIYKPEETGGKYSTSLKEKNFQPRILYLAKLSFISEGK